MSKVKVTNTQFHFKGLVNMYMCIKLVQFQLKK